MLRREGIGVIRLVQDSTVAGIRICRIWQIAMWVFELQGLLSSGKVKPVTMVSTQVASGVSSLIRTVSVVAGSVCSLVGWEVSCGRGGLGQW